VASAPTFTVASAVITPEVPTIRDLIFLGAAGADLLAVILAASGTLKFWSTASDSTPFLTPTTLSGIDVPESSLSKSILQEALEPAISPKSLLLSTIPSWMKALSRDLH